MSLLLSNVSGVFLSAAAVFSVLKIIGFVLLIILIVVVALALCVMFLPARYRAKGDIDEMNFSVKLHWFLKIITFRASYKDGAGDYALYIFGIRTKLLEEEASTRRKHRRQRRKARKAARKHKSRKKKYQKEHDKYKEQFLKENPLDEETLQTVQAEKTKVQNATSTSDFNSEENTSGKKKVTPSSAVDVVKKAVHIIKTFMEYRPVRLLWDDIKKLLYRARPRKIIADIQFGFEDPALTGQILGAISNLYFIYQFDKLCINADFETDESYIHGNFDIRGHIQAIYAIIFVIRVMKKKQFKKFMNALKL